MCIACTAFRPTEFTYGLVRHKGKLVRKSLQTRDKAVAKRKLQDFQRDLGKVDPSSGRLTLGELCKRYLATVKNRSEATMRRKHDIVSRLLADFPSGADIQGSKVKSSDIETWLAGYAPSNNLHLACIEAIFRLAVAAKVIIQSPVEDAKRKKVVKPIWLTPAFDEFNAIVADVRTQRFNAEAKTSTDFLELMGLVGVGQTEITGLLGSTSTDPTNESPSSGKKPRPRT